MTLGWWEGNRRTTISRVQIAVMLEHGLCESNEWVLYICAKNPNQVLYCYLCLYRFSRWQAGRYADWMGDIKNKGIRCISHHGHTVISSNVGFSRRGGVWYCEGKGTLEREEKKRVHKIVQLISPEWVGVSQCDNDWSRGAWVSRSWNTDYLFFLSFVRPLRIATDFCSASGLVEWLVTLGSCLILGLLTLTCYHMPRWVPSRSYPYLRLLSTDCLTYVLIISSPVWYCFSVT